MFTKEELLEKYKNLPMSIEFPDQMQNPNSTIKIYEGEFEIVRTDKAEKVFGVINLKWLPNIDVEFEVKIPTTGGFLGLECNLSEELTIKINDFDAGQIRISHQSLKMPENQIELRGYFTKGIVLGDNSVEVQTIRFAVPNLRKLTGASDFRDEERVYFSQRITLDANDYVIKLDRVSNYEKLEKELDKSGGFAITHIGEAISVKKQFAKESVKIIQDELRLFLSFLNGSKTSLISTHGIFEDKSVWREYRNTVVDTYKYVQSWLPKYDSSDLENLYKMFYELFKKDGCKDFLQTVVHWYNSANTGAGAIEGSIVLAQTALELIFNWWIVEQKKMILGEDSKDLSASNKIRLILSQLNQSSDIPNHYRGLKDVVRNTGETQDAPEAITQIRNAIVHSHKEKRKKLKDISVDAKFFALQMSIWYIELSLLKILEYNGKYQNRCSEIQADQYVPWVKE